MAEGWAKHGKSVPKAAEKPELTHFSFGSNPGHLTHLRPHLWVREAGTKV